MSARRRLLKHCTLSTLRHRRVMLLGTFYRQIMLLGIDEMDFYFVTSPVVLSLNIVSCRRANVGVSAQIIMYFTFIWNLILKRSYYMIWLTIGRLLPGTN